VKRRGNFYFLILAFIAGLFLRPNSLRAQSDYLHGLVLDAITSRPIPFPIISVEGDSAEYLGDMEGKFSLPKKNRKAEYSIRIRAYQYLFTEIKVADADSVKAELYYAHSFTWQNISLRKDKAFIKRILKSRSMIDPEKERNYRYKSYNKSVVSTDNISALKIYLDNWLHHFTSASLGQYSLDHHIFLMESASSRIFLDPGHQKETVIATQASGLNKPQPLSWVSGFDALSIFDPFLRIGPQKYVSPLAGNALGRYAFSVIDSVRTEAGKVFVVRFNPLSIRKKNLLQGLLYIAENPLGVCAFLMWPSYDRESGFSLAQECSLIPSGRWFPSVIRTSYLSEELGSLRIPVRATSKTWINDFHSEKTSSLNFNEEVFDFRKRNLLTDTGFPASLRPQELSQRDKNTYLFFNQVGSLERIDRFLSFGQKLVSGRFPAGKVDIVFWDAIRVNDREGIRLGLGLETSDKFSEKFKLGGYGAYGLKDEVWKYGLAFRWNHSESQSFSLDWKSDISEPGIFPLAFERKQYPTENLRNIRVSRFDAYESVETGWNVRAFRNFYCRLSIEAGRKNYLYNYSFLPQKDATGFGLLESKMQFCWSPLERFARLENQTYSLGSTMPVFWFQYVKGFGGILPASFSYQRLEARGQWSRKILGIGEVGIRVSAGLQDGLVPYPLLFSGRASYREFSILSYNSFETMRYNEFFFNRFLNVFYSHKFGKMQISTLPFLPYFTFVHNMGWGILDKPELHQGIKVQDMRKGFFESGLILNDLFVVPLSGLDLGVGAGAFLRYGPNRLPSNFDNLSIKFSATLGF
jgi:hypothetical protein